MSTTLASPHLEVKTINANHPGSDFGVVLFEESDSQMTLKECLDLLAEDGWTNAEEVSFSKSGMRKFLVTRKK
jgi:hypothetical protein